MAIMIQSKGWICNACRAAAKKSKPLQRRGYASVAQFRKQSQLLPSSPARTRFAPSPTGYLHLGSLRTALFNYLIAKATGGQFLLRIEDTDTKRTVPGALERICRDLEWAGLQWDEGPEVGGPYGPYRQSERKELYTKHAKDLLASGHAYRCFCSAERLDELARERSKLGLPTDYDRTCMGIPAEEADDRACKGHAHTIRLKVPDVYPKYEDLVYGRVGSANGKSKKMIYGQQSFEDPILVKSDGHPTYHLANVVDDHHMKITHVVRAVEWMPSTPKHLAMYEAFGWTPPAFAHVGLLQDQSRQKLSKRNLDIDIESFRKDGIFPETLVNHVALLGWSHNETSDFLPLEKLVDIFDLKFTKGNTVVNFNKLTHLQKLYSQHFIENKGLKFEEMTDALLSVVEQQQNTRPHCPQGKDLRSYTQSVLESDNRHYVSAKDFYNRNRNFFLPGETMDWIERPQLASQFDHEAVYRSLEQVSASDWNESCLKAAQGTVVDQVLESTGLHTTASSESRIDDSKPSREKIGTDLSRYLRWAIMNSRPGPPIALTLELLGRDETLSRLRNAHQAAFPRSDSSERAAASA